MKVLFVTNMYPSESKPYFGIFVKEQKEFLEKTYGHDIDLYVIKGKIGYLKSLFKVKTLLKYENYDVIHTHFGFSALYTLLSKKAANRTIITFHGSDLLRKHLFKDKIFRIFLKRITKRSAHIIVQNKEMQSILIKTNQRTSVVNCGVDCDVFKPNHKIQREETPVIAFTSNRDNKVKNWKLFNETIEILNRERKVNYCEISNMTRPEISDLFSRVNCLLMTSFTEGSPQIVKEALACNCPVVSVDVGDVKNQLKGVDNCYVSQKYSAPELAKHIEKIIINKNIRSNGAENLALKELTQSAVVNKINDIYKLVKSENA